MLVRLDAVSAGDIQSVGGKAANLGELLRAGIPLPPGFVVPSEVYAEVASRGDIPAAIASLEHGTPEACSVLVRQAFRDLPLGAELRSAIADAYAELAPDAGPVAVRSSATAEDLPEASFAGQQETFLGVRGVDALLLAVRECWSSLFTPRAIAYRERNGYRHSEVRLAVVVQRMVRPTVSGVMFTVDPVHGRRDQMVVDASWGLGEALVSGRVSPDSYTLNREGHPLVAARTLGDKAVRIDAAPLGGTFERAVAEADRARETLDPPALAALRATGLRVERHFGRPQDIEWAFEDDRLHVLQARPITSLCPPPPSRAALGRGERFVFDDIVEHFPEAPHPLDYDAVATTYEQIQCAIRDAGLDAPPATSIITFQEDGVCQVMPRAPRLGWRALGLPWFLLDLARAPAGEWLRLHAARVESTTSALVDSDLLRSDDGALANFLNRSLDLAADVGRQRFRLVLAPMIVTGALLSALGKVASQEVDSFAWLAGLSHHTARTEAALQRLADHANTNPALREALLTPGGLDDLQALGAGDAQWGALCRGFLHDYGARTMRLYLPFTARSWSEDPATLVATLQSIVRADRPDAAEQRMIAGRARLAEHLDRVCRKLPRLLRGTLTRAVARFRDLHVEREATVFAIERAYVQARRAVREVEARLVRREDLCAGDSLFLRIPELLALFDRRLSRVDARRLVLTRRGRRPAAIAHWQAHRVDHDLHAAPLGRRGQAGSPGIAEGPVRVVRSPAEFERVVKGDVIVCPFTDPAWTPLFALASAIVAETGGPLSHAAIVAREYGLPAVLGVRSATTDLTDGELVRVDGTRGLVERLGADALGSGRLG